jgi:16S rRNA (guanine966-N2)-methyltransferase
MRIIGGSFKGRQIKAPVTKTTRPTQGMLREAVFNICQIEIEGASFCDLYAGSGAMGFEALSRGASHITLAEQNRSACQCIKENIRLLDVSEKTTLFQTNAERALKELIKQRMIFDILYIDPPYGLKVDLETLAPIARVGAILFLEEKDKTPTKEFPSWRLKNSRRFGIAQLTIYERT